MNHRALLVTLDVTPGTTEPAPEQDVERRPRAWKLTPDQLREFRQTSDWGELRRHIEQAVAQQRTPAEMLDIIE